MIEIAAATEDEMIAAFLRAEVDSWRYSGSVNHWLAQLGWDRGLLDMPDTTNQAQNRARRAILEGYRGYPDQLLFKGFPVDVIWRRVQLEPRDFDTVRYANDVLGDQRLWNLSGGTRRVIDGARNFIRQPPIPATAHIGPIVTALRKGQVFAPLISAEDLDGSLILVEGHSRATAYVIEHFAGKVEAFVGASPSLSRWALY